MKNSKIILLALAIATPIISMEMEEVPLGFAQNSLRETEIFLVKQNVEASGLMVVLNGFHYTAHALQVADRLKSRKPALMSTPSVAAWHKAAKARLESGAELYQEVMANNKEAVSRLVKDKKNLDFNWQNPAEENRSVLALASVYGQVEIVETLVRAGANPNPEDGKGRTPLWEAAYNGKRSVVEKLVAAGAKIDKIVEGRTIIDWTQRRGFTELARYLEIEKGKQR